MARHEIRPERSALHGQYAADLAPALTIDSGDTVVFRDTLDVTWGLEQQNDPPTPRRRFGPLESPRDDGPALHGPVAVRGAEPGGTLALHIEAVRPASWGWTWIGDGPFNGALNRALGLPPETKRVVRWEIDADAGEARCASGHRVALRPFPGMIGLCPAGPGWHEAWSPRRCGGNLDCRELVAGSTLYLPIEVAGGLLSVGDGHATQGDGELAGTAIECRMERVEVCVELAPEMTVKAPRIRTARGWVTCGVGRDLDDAVAMATAEMLDHLMARYDVTRGDALALATTCVDLRITQLVNGVRGVHAVLADGAIR